MTLHRIILAVGFLLVCAAPALLALHAEHDAGVDACTTATVSRLYLGRSAPTGEVSEAQWMRFVAESVATRFPDGFTVLDGHGHWRDRNGRAQEESTRILEVAHDDAPGARAQVRAIAGEYRARFAQESVLITQLPARQCQALAD